MRLLPLLLTGSEPLRVLVWNIQSPEYSPNALEFLPGSNALTEEGVKSWDKLLAVARNYMVRPTESPRLSGLLGNEPLDLLTDLERAPITCTTCRASPMST